MFLGICPSSIQLTDKVGTYFDSELRQGIGNLVTVVAEGAILRAFSQYLEKVVILIQNGHRGKDGKPVGNKMKPCDILRCDGFCQTHRFDTFEQLLVSIGFEVKKFDTLFFFDFDDRLLVEKQGGDQYRGKCAEDDQDDLLGKRHTVGHFVGIAQKGIAPDDSEGCQREQQQPFVNLHHRYSLKFIRHYTAGVLDVPIIWDILTKGHLKKLNFFSQYSGSRKRKRPIYGLSAPLSHWLKNVFRGAQKQKRRGRVVECKHFGVCGSCNFYQVTYAEQLKEKANRVAALLAPSFQGSLEVFDSPDTHYRARAEFRIWHEGAHCDYAMGRMDKKGAVTIEECPKVSKAIEKRMWRLLGEINASERLRSRLFSVEFLTTTTDECLITLLYHRKLDALWEAEAGLLEGKLECRIIGRSRKQKRVLSDEFVTERLRVDGREVVYRQYESGFTQPNPAVNSKMIEWACAQAKKIAGGDFLESYCGLGNFTIPLSHYFGKVLATEVSKRSIRAAQENCRLNDVDNIAFVRLSSEELTEALKKIRPFRRLEGIDLDGYATTFQPCWSTLPGQAWIIRP